jgi:putative oxidoreductase
MFALHSNNNCAMTTPSETHKKYLIRASLFMGAYVAVNIAAITGAFDDMKPPGTWAFALVVAAPVIGHIWAFLVWMRDSDEFLRSLAAKRFIVAAGVALAVTSIWGFMELYAKAPHISAAMVYPLLWAAFGIVTPFIRTSH